MHNHTDKLLHASLILSRQIPKLHLNTWYLWILKGTLCCDLEALQRGQMPPVD